MKKKEDWFKDAVIYELHPRSFNDSNGDGIGDLNGITEKLDYLHDLGITTLWLLPFYPSPLKDDGYDITDYTGIHPDLGTMEDFERLIREARKRDLKVIIELVLNHTSDQHPWFQKARHGDKKYKDFYTWSDSPDKNPDARVIFKDYESSNWAWDNEAKAYYWHRFYHHQPDLNYDNNKVEKEITKVVNFWLEKGVDGFRLVNVPFLYEKDNTDCENLPETHDFLKRLRKHIDKNFPDRVLIAETNLWPEDAATYFGKGDEAHMAQYYPLMPRLFMALYVEDGFPVTDIIEQTPAPPEKGQWALFLRNHDEMALEMVTEEEKGYLYRAYASDPVSKLNIGIRRRLAPLLENDRRKIELLFSLMFSLPGSPIIYYGDEIGMGDNVYLGDRDGVRTPMQWNTNVNAGFSDANPQKLYLPVINDPNYRFESVNVANQQKNLASLLWWIKNIINVRKRFVTFGRGNLKFLETSNSKILAFAREYEGQRIIVVTNLSKNSQAVEIDLSAYKGSGLTEVFSQNSFPPVGNHGYPLTLGPYGYFWLLADEEVDGEDKPEGQISLKTDAKWEDFFTSYKEVSKLEKQILPEYLNKCRWFGGKARKISKVKVDQYVSMKYAKRLAYFVVLEVSYVQLLPEYYFLPVSCIAKQDIVNIDETKNTIICELQTAEGDGFLIDTSYDELFRNHLFKAMAQNSSVKASDGRLSFQSGKKVKLEKDIQNIRSEVLKADQSNTAIIYNKAFFFKFYRKVEKEINPDLEIVRFLSEQTDFKNSPSYAGSVELQMTDGKSIVFGLLQGMVDNKGEAWTMTMDALGRYYDRIIESKDDNDQPPEIIDKPALFLNEVPEVMQEMIGPIFYQRVIRLGQRTAEMHLALASDKKDNAFKPEKLDSNYQRSLFSSMRKLMKDRLKLLDQKLNTLPKSIKPLASEILENEKVIMEIFSRIYEHKINGVKTRIHGDYHLGQVLFTGKDFVIIDYEGEPGFSFGERRLKKNPFKDVAGMIRSFHYAAYGKIMLNDYYREKYQGFLDPWAEQWFQYVSKFYLAAYLERMDLSLDLSKDSKTLLEVYTLEKAIYELGYELNSRPDWVGIPLQGIKYLIDQFSKTK